MDIKNDRISEIYSAAKSLEKQEFQGKIVIHCTEAVEIISRMRAAEAKLAAMESQEPCIHVHHKYLSISTNREYMEKNFPGEYSSYYSKPVTADKPARITEQDARDIAMDAVIHYSQKHGMDYAEWMRSGGRTLLNKLNADREQVPAVSVPDCVSKVCRDWAAHCAAVDEYNREREEVEKRRKFDDWGGDLNNEFQVMNDTGNAYHEAVRAMIAEITPMLASAPSHSQQSADAVKAFCKDIGLYDPEYDDQEYIEVSRYKLRDHVDSLYDRCPSHESEQNTKALPEMHNIQQVERVGDQSVRIMFASCRAASAFERAIRMTAPDSEWGGYE